MFTARAIKISSTIWLLTIILVVSVTLLARPVDHVVNGSTDASTIITNQAEATYNDEAGSQYTAVSTTTNATVPNVARIVVTPDQAEPSETIAAQEQITRLFRVCNAGSVIDSASITQFELPAPATLQALYFDNDGSGTVTTGDTPITLTGNESPALPPRECIGVLAAINTNDVAPQTTVTIRLTARSNATNVENRGAVDTGTIVNVVGNGSSLTDPNNPSLPPNELINGVPLAVVNQNEEFSYSITFTNGGDVVARNVRVLDQLPPEIAYSPGSLQLNNRSLSDAADADEGSVLAGIIRVQLAGVGPAEVVRIAFRARLVGVVPSGSGVVNTAEIIADNVDRITTSTATLIVDPTGTVFAGRAGSSVPLAGARIELFTDQNLTNLLPLPPGQGFAPNEKNENPFVSDGQGHFSFVPPALTSTQIYYMRVTAQGYILRGVRLTVSPSPINASSVSTPGKETLLAQTTAGSGLFSVTMHALDNQPLALPGSFELVREDVQINNLAALVMNVPMFEPTGLQILKSADRAQAEIGDTITYRIEVHNPTSVSINNVVITDRPPPSFHFAQGSGRIRTSKALPEPIEPETLNGGLQFRIGEIPNGATAHLLYRVRVGANASEGEQVNIAMASGAFSSGELTTSVNARAVVRISAGVFSTRQVIVGRVFVDTNGNGNFDDKDRPAPDIRLYLSNGQSVITDSAGLYNFPSLGDGPQVVSLDPVTLPQGYALADGGRESGKGWTRLLRTPVGGGALLRQNFILVETNKPTNTSPPVPSASPAPSPSPALVGPVATPMQLTSSTASGESVGSKRTYEIAAPDNIEPIAAGDVRIVSPLADSVSMSPGAKIEAQTALNWTVKLEVNGEQISIKNIGMQSVDHKNQITTFAFVGISLRPGPNKISCTAISPNNTPGKSQQITVMGRGPATQLQIVTEKTEIQNGGDSTIVRVRAFDEWNNPALDGQVGIETSSGELAHINDKPVTTNRSKLTGLETSPEQMQQGQINQSPSQVVAQTENGEVVLKLIGSGTPGEARLHARTGQLEAEESVRIISEVRRPILVGFAEMSFGNSIPEVNLRNEQGNYRSRISFFYSGQFFGDNMLTLSYDTQRPINRTAGRDRMFQLDPLERVYPLFGDSSTRFEAAPTNSKLYARIDRKRSFVMFGDFETGMDAELAGYTRKLTGVVAHLENSNGDFITLTGARPDTAFAREVFPGGTLGLIQLSHAEILPGSETVVLELRDRRNPEVIISSETLVRSVDYNLDPGNGQLFFLRYISTFDRVLNLMQIVVTYEHRATSMSSAVYTGRVRKNFKGLGLKVGASAALQREGNLPDFFIGGVDLEKTLPRKGVAEFAWATSQGQIPGLSNFTSSQDPNHDGNAFLFTLDQPLPFFGSTLRARFVKATEGFFNPFGGTVTPGSRRGEVAFEMKPGEKSLLHFGVTSERNRTVNVDNSRLTFSGALDQVIKERVKLHFGFDHRSLTDDLNQKSIDSNLVTFGAEIQATEKLRFSARREQNLTESDPTYPNQTTLAATYQLNTLTKLFFTQRLASGSITPIGDFTANGFASVQSRRETAFGVETRFGKYTSMTGRYQLENAINGTDSFAVIGLQNHLPLTKQLSLETGFERGFHLVGPNRSFNSVTAGFGWTPNSDFRASARYEYRDRGGIGKLFTVGAAGRLTQGITALSRFQFSRGSFEGRTSESTEGIAALAIRPLESDRTGLLFSYEHRSMTQKPLLLKPTRDRLDSISTDAYHQLTRRLELYGHFALRLTANGQPDLPFVSTTSFLAQARAQYLLTTRLDWAIETRLLFQPSSHTSRRTYATELGFWVLPDLRVGGGYNFTGAQEPAGSNVLPRRRGFYFTISTKLSHLFDLFGTSSDGLANKYSQSSTDPEKSEVKKH